MRSAMAGSIEGLGFLPYVLEHALHQGLGQFGCRGKPANPVPAEYSDKQIGKCQPNCSTSSSHWGGVKVVGDCAPAAVSSTTSVSKRSTGKPEL